MFSLHLLRASNCWPSDGNALAFLQLPWLSVGRPGRCHSHAHGFQSRGLLVFTIHLTGFQQRRAGRFASALPRLRVFFYSPGWLGCFQVMCAASDATISKLGPHTGQDGA